MTDHRYKIAHSDIVFEDFDGEKVVLDLRSGNYFDFNPVAAALWDALLAGASRAVFAAAGLSPQRAEAFLALVVQSGLAVADPDAAPLGAADAVTQTLATALALAGDEDPRIGVFDDLADLMQADPIHEVDAEYGWPHRPPADG